MPAARFMLLSSLVVSSAFLAPLGAAELVPATRVGAAPANEGSLVALPDGELQFFYVVPNERIESIVSRDHGRTWSAPRVEFKFGGLRTHLCCRALVDQKGRRHVFFVVWPDRDQEPRSPKALDVWHNRTFGPDHEWGRPHRVFTGYVGSIRGAVQMRGGRLVIALGVWNDSESPPRRGPQGTGTNFVTTAASDDGGATWKVSDAMLTAPVTPNYNGANYGAIEPEMVELGDGRLWMVMRTQTGRLYQTFSTDGSVWTPAEPTEFYSSNSPAAPLRLRDGRLLLVWNNCGMPAREKGMLYAGRDVLHAAISDDDGRTWRGFREILRDPHRNDRPIAQGDRGVAYPAVAEAADGTVVVFAGQGERHRSIVRFSPDWLTQASCGDDFSQGLEQWSAFKEYGEKFRIFLPRKLGPKWIEAPDDSSRRGLHVRTPAGEAADCAVWNFPAARQGRLALEIQVPPGSRGGELALTDCFYNPNDPQGAARAMFRWPLGSSEEAPLAPAGRWRRLELKWDVAEQTCRVVCDGKVVSRLTIAAPSRHGVSYLRLRGADRVDPAGYLVRSVQFSTAPSAAAPQAPEILPLAPKRRPVVLPDGTLQVFDGAAAGWATSRRSSDGGRTWSTPEREFQLPPGAGGGGLPVLSQEGELHVIFIKGRGEGRPDGERNIDLWHVHTLDGRTRWSQPRMVWEGYCGAVLDFQQLSGGRLVVPFAAWRKKGEPEAPGTGTNYTTAIYSDDQGRIWTQSPARLTAPCEPNYNGANYGAIEPTIVELKDGRVWMLMRTQTGWLYESFSSDGAAWSAARPSAFHSSTSPASLVRLDDGRLVLLWNNCAMPTRVDGEPVYGGRDALHAAISTDEGATWRGFREIYRDPRRNDTPPLRGDRGTAYPVATALRDGRVGVATGQGDRRTFLRLDPTWLLATTHGDDFSEGLDAWHVWKGIGPAKRYWRDRRAGAELVAHPSRAGVKVLHVRRADEHDGDGAVWNFPAGARGRLRCRMMLQPGFQGADLALTDQFYDPTDARGEADAALRLTLPADGQGENFIVPVGAWIDLVLAWDLPKQTATLSIDGGAPTPLAVHAAPPQGLSYLRFRSTTPDRDPAGMLVESVQVEILP